MADVTLLLDAAAAGDRKAAADLLPLVYDELRKLAAARMAEEAPGNTLSATALVHEAYLRLVGPEDVARWESRGHFFAAAAEAMRRILDKPRRPDSLGRIGDYDVLEVLGRGGCGIVLKAFDEMLHRAVAVKVMTPELARTSPARKRF